MPKDFDLSKYKSIAVVGVRTGGSAVNGHEAEKRLDRDLDRYASARKEGIQPDACTRKATERAQRWSDKFGTAYTGNDRTSCYTKAGLVESVTPIRGVYGGSES